MKDDRFDRLATSLASPTRRGALLVAGIALCGLGGIFARPKADSVLGERHRAGKHKRKRRRQRRSGGGGPALYPDLKTLPPADLCFDEVAGQRVLRFTNTVWNAGKGRLELEAATSAGDEDAGKLFQNLYDKPIGGKRVKRRRVNGEIVYHPSHEHYHFADFAVYQLLKRDDGGEYRPVSEGVKTSFCIFDNVLLKGKLPRQYETCEAERQGLTPGWRDTYRWNLPEQWVALEAWPLPDGNYRLQSVADLDGLLGEGGGGAEDNNAGVTGFRPEDVPDCDELIFP